MSDTPIMLSRNPDNRDRTHWLDDAGENACWDSHQECARHKVEQLTAALAAQAARAEQLAAALEVVRARTIDGQPCWCRTGEMDAYYPAHGYHCGQAKRALDASTVEAESSDGAPMREIEARAADYWLRRFQAEEAALAAQAARADRAEKALHSLVCFMATRGEEG